MEREGTSKATVPRVFGRVPPASGASWGRLCGLRPVGQPLPKVGGQVSPKRYRIAFPVLFVGSIKAPARQPRRQRIRARSPLSSNATSPGPISIPASAPAGAIGQNVGGEPVSTPSRQPSKQSAAVV